jgi:hypothetical protein
MTVQKMQAGNEHQADNDAKAGENGHALQRVGLQPGKGKFQHTELSRSRRRILRQIAPNSYRKVRSRK